MRKGGMVVLISLIVGLLAIAPASTASAQVVHKLTGEDRQLDAMPEDLFSIGALEGRAWEVLSRVRAVDFDAQGNLYVLDGGARVLKFGPDGSFVRQIGRKGRGPGEIELPRTMVVGDDGTVVVVDPSAGYHIFAPDGEYDRTIRPSIPAFSSRAVLVDNALVLPGGGLASIRAGRQGRGLPLVRQPLESRAGAQVIYETTAPTIESSVSGANDGEATFTFRRPPRYSPTLKIAAATEGAVAVVSGTDWEIEVLTASGEVSARLQRPLAGRPSNEADREAVERQAREAGDRARSFGGGAPGAALGSRVGPSIAETIPVVRSLRGDGTGLLFVARETNPVAGDEPPIDVVRTDGTYVGTILGQSLPAAFGPDRRAAYVEADDLGVERVVVRRLPGPWFGE